MFLVRPHERNHFYVGSIHYSFDADICFLQLYMVFCPEFFKSPLILALNSH